MTVAKKVPVTLNGEERSLLFDLVAFEAAGVNPFKAGTADSLSAFMEDFNPRKAAVWIRAGLLHEYEEGEPRSGETPPTVDAVFKWINKAFREGSLTEMVKLSLGRGDEQGDGKAPNEAAA